MKLVFLALLSLSAASVTNPVTRVVELLKGLSANIEKEGAKEEDLYETYVCWGKGVIEEKTNSNVAANSKIEELTAYIADLESGRIELTSERANLEKDIEELMADLELAKSNRNQENKDFLGAEAEMKKAVAALDSAMDVLKEATKGSKKSALMAVRQSLSGGIEALAERQAHLRDAVDFGQRFLSKGDALFLRRLLLGDVPKVDWKKLNRKATFKMAYKARSGKIQEVLAKIHQTFSKNLKDAQEKEADAKASYTKLSTAKQAQLDTATDALSKQESENGAKGMSKQNAKNEVASLKKQVSNDEKFIKDTTKALEDKKGGWKVRTELRSQELAAISKAIFILHNDDARDLMTKSFSSQGFFLQIAQSSQTTTANSAAAALREAARRSGDERLAVLAAGLANADPASVKSQFGPVLKSIDTMISILKSDEQTDLDTKETCEKDRMADTQKAIVAGRAIDDMTDTITRLTSEIAALQSEMDKLQAEHDKVEDELKKASNIRKEEHAAWLVTDSDDEKAAETVNNAKIVLAKFYSDNKLSLAQHAKQAPGDAPVPPPATWEAPYGGKTGESQGIVALMTMVHEDILSDRSSAKKDEDNSQKEFDSFKKASEDQMKELMSDKNAAAKTQGEKGTEKSQTGTSRKTKKGELTGTLDKINKINPNCEYYTVNYPLRRENRKIEIDGLEKAKAILKGGSFKFLQKHA